MEITIKEAWPYAYILGFSHGQTGGTEGFIGGIRTGIHQMEGQQA